MNKQSSIKQRSTAKLDIKKAVTPRELRQFRKFARDLYKGDSGWVASRLYVLDIFLKRKDSFCKEALILPVMVIRHKEILAQCIFVSHPGLPVLQIAFFEALAEENEAVDRLLTAARTHGRENGCKEIVAGLNGHLAYGVGIMTGGWGRPTSFDSLYHKDYYADYFRRRGLKEFSLSTYQFDPRELDRRYSPFSRSYPQFSFRSLDMNRWEEEMTLFGELSNRCLNQTRYYFERPGKQLYELMSEMKFFMKPEYLVFIMKGEEEIGFLFWYPDFNEVLRPGQYYSVVKFGLRYLFHRKPFETLKVNAIGILPRYRKTAAAMGLMMAGLNSAGLNYSRGETNFVWDCNEDSRRFNLGMGGQVDRRYSVFCDKIEGDYV
ncbi:MAG: hypothetical protein JEY99_12400 [Spirochaetales bacterium]|nr:hypothetical protein [Spirochaetales bacterium]